MSLNDFNTTAEKITANDAIIKMIDYINNDKRELFYQVVDKYCKGMAASSDIRYKIQRLFQERPLQMIKLSELSNDIKKLITQSIIPVENVFLNDPTKDLINDLLFEWKNVEIFRYHNLGIRNKILFHGPTGNGKTTIARHIAVVANLPYVEVNSDTVIDSHIGATGTNIWNVFNKIQEPCVLFWDEIDSIGRKRGAGNDSAAGMENERMVNSVLTNIEKLSNDVIFIGATNRKDVLDSAFLRRFDVEYEITEPSEIEKERFAQQSIVYYKLPESFLPKNISKFKNYSEIKLHFTDMARRYVLSKIINSE